MGNYPQMLKIAMSLRCSWEWVILGITSLLSLESLPIHVQGHIPGSDRGGFPLHHLLPYELSSRQFSFCGEKASVYHSTGHHDHSFSQFW